MDVVDIARWQFGIITVYHFLFVPLTIGLSAIVAGFETAWVRTGDEQWLRLIDVDAALRARSYQPATGSVVLGSSLSVFPAADFPVRAKQNGAALVIVNRDPTPIDELSDVVINAGIGDTMTPEETLVELAASAQREIELRLALDAFFMEAKPLWDGAAPSIRGCAADFNAIETEFLKRMADQRAAKPLVDRHLRNLRNLRMNPLREVLKSAHEVG